VLTPVASPSPPSLEPAAPVVLPAAPSCGTAVGVAAREWALTRASVCAGPVVVQVRNDGEDDHDVKVLRDGALVASFPVLHPGEGETRALDLTPGAYELLCSLTGGEPPSAASHAEAGMRAVLSAAAAPG